MIAIVVGLAIGWLIGSMLARRERAPEVWLIVEEVDREL